MGIYRADQTQGDRSVTISRRLYQELVRASRRSLEAWPFSRDRGLGHDRGMPTSPGAGFSPAAVPGIVTTPITACTLSSGNYTPGSGVVSFYWLDLDDSITTAIACTDDYALVTVRNWYLNSGTIASGKSVWCTWWSGAFWFLGSDC